MLGICFPSPVYARLCTSQQTQTKLNKAPLFLNTKCNKHNIGHKLLTILETASSHDLKGFLTDLAEGAYFIPQAD